MKLSTQAGEPQEDQTLSGHAERVTLGASHQTERRELALPQRLCPWPQLALSCRLSQKHRQGG